MVQIIQMPLSPKALSQSTLAKALGEGLGNFTGSYFADKSLNKVLNDPSLQNAPLSEKMSALESSLRPYGERGQKMLQTRMQIEQQAIKEQEQQKQLIKQGILSKALSGQVLSDKEQQMLSPQEQIAIAKIKSQENIAGIRSQNKAPPGGLSGQPVPQEVSQKINEVLRENPESNPDQLTVAMDMAGVPRAYSNSIIENRRQNLKPVFEPTEQKLEAERVSKIADEVSRDYQSAQAEDLRLDRMQKLSEKGNLSTPLMMKTLETLGLPLGILGNPETEEYSKLESDFVRDVSKVFPGQIRVFEIQAYLRTIPSLMNSEEGRKSIIRNRKLLNEAKKIKYDEYKNILKENNGKKPRNLDLLLEERTSTKLNEIAEKFREGVDSSLEKQLPKMKMYDNQGKSYEIPSHLIPQAQKQGLIFK